MHDGELGSAVAFLVCLILLSCFYHTTFSTMQLEASKEVKNDSRWLLDSVLVKLVVVTAWIWHLSTDLIPPVHTSLPQPSSTGWLSTSLTMLGRHKRHTKKSVSVTKRYALITITISHYLQCTLPYICSSTHRPQWSAWTPMGTAAFTPPCCCIARVTEVLWMDGWVIWDNINAISSQ